jgi:D-alanyl-D-alanine carboxypeptidase
MLLNHTSGIGEWVGEYESIFKNDPQDKIWQDSEFLDLAVKAGPNFKPGEKWLYNNTEYTLLGMIIERKTELSWRENIRQRIFAKLELKNTLLPEPGDVKMPGSYINGYEIFSGVLTDTTEVDPSMAGAAGGHALVTNTEDLSIFIQALLSGAFFEKEETLSAMLNTVDTGAPGRSYGLGLGRYTLPSGSYAYGHTGGTAGYATFVFHFPEEGITAASVLSTDQGDAVLGYLLPSLGVVAQRSTLH